VLGGVVNKTTIAREIAGGQEWGSGEVKFKFGEYEKFG
jgi:hypothetical protein